MGTKIALIIIFVIVIISVTITVRWLKGNDYLPDPEVIEERFYPLIPRGKHRYPNCSNCEEGTFMPKFHSWRYIFFFSYFVLGPPDYWECDVCGEKSQKSFGYHLLTPIYLSHKLSFRGFMVIILIILIFVIFILIS